MTRYYDPTIGQFISPDGFELLKPDENIGISLYCYCKFNPLINSDPYGQFSMLTLFTVAASALVSAGRELMDDLKDGKLLNDKDIFDYLGAFVGGAISGLGKSPVGGVFFGTLGDMVDAAISGELNEDNAGNMLKNSVISNVVGEVTGGVAEKGVRRAMSNFKASRIIKMKGKVSNNVINKKLRQITNNLNIGAKKATKSNIADQIFKKNVWAPAKYTGVLASLFFSIEI